MAQWLLSKVGLGTDPKDTFGFNVGEKVGEVGLWDLHACSRKVDNEAMSVLIFDKVRHSRFAALGTNAFNSMRRLRHPAMVHFVDGRETPEKLFVVCEQVRPLRHLLPGLHEGHPGALAWGLHEIARAVSFLNNDCSLVHGYLTVDTVVVNRAMDWKLAGLELVSDPSKRDQPLETFHTLLPDAFKPPELLEPQLWLSVCKSPRTFDPWLLGCLVSQVFHNNAGAFRGETQLKDMTPVPTGLRDEYKDLLRPFQRRTMENFLGSRYFKDDYVQSMFFLETIALKDDYEKDQFFKRLQPLIQALPPEVSRFKVLPELVKGLDYGTANFRVLGPILEIGEGMSEDEYKKLVGSSVVKWFASPDRSLRRNLLEHLATILTRLDAATVNDKIFPHIADGFEDKSPVLREMTVKAVLTLAPKLKAATLETDVLKHFARLQLDAEPGIRTNTTICLGKIADFLTPQTRQKVLAAAFIRALKDHFPPSRLAGVMSLNATAALYSVQEVAKRIIPALSHMTIDSDPRVREEAFKAIKAFILVLENQYNALSDDQFTREATKDMTERTVLDWASGLVGKATQHVTAVAANKVLGTPMPKAAPPPPKYSEDHVRAVAEQVKADASAAPAKSAAAAATPKKQQANDWGEAFSSTADSGMPSSSSASSGALPSAAPKVVISDGWGDVDDEKWSDEDNNDADSGGWNTVYRPGASSAATPSAPIVKPVVAPVVAPPVVNKPVSAPQPTLGQIAASKQQPQLQQPQPSFASFQPQQPQPVVAQPQKVSIPASAFVSTLPAAQPQKSAVSDGWESFSFGSTSSASTPASSAAFSNEGWGDLSFLESKKPAAPSSSSTSSSAAAADKSTKKTKKHAK